MECNTTENGAGDAGAGVALSGLARAASCILSKTWVSGRYRLVPCAAQRDNKTVMRTVISIAIVLLIAFGIYRLYLTRVQPAGGGTAPTQAITITGVQNDLLAIAQAERLYFAEHGSYASLDELISSGALLKEKTGRDGYSYSVETTANSFTVTASYSGPPGAHYPRLVIDETMQIRRIE